MNKILRLLKGIKNFVTSSKVFVSFLLVTIILWVGLGQIRFHRELEKEKKTVKESSLKPIVKPKIKDVKEITFGSKYSYYGKINLDSNTNVKSEITSSISKILVTEGQYVKKGQKMVILDTRSYQKKFQSDQKAFESASLRYDASKKLYDKKLIGKVELKDVESALENAKSNFENSKNNLEKTVIKAPFSGYVEDIFVSENDSIFVQDELLKVVSKDKVYVDLELPSGIKSDKSGDIFVKYESDKGMKMIPAKVDYYSRVVNEGVNTTKVRLEILGSKAERQNFRHNQMVEVTLVVGNIKGYEIPLSAVIVKDGSNGVNIVDEEGRVSFCEIEIVDSTPEYYLSTTESKCSKPNISIITLGSYYLNEGVKVI